MEATINLELKAALLADCRLLELQLGSKPITPSRKAVKKAGDVVTKHGKWFQDPKVKIIANRMRGAIVGYFRKLKDRLVIRARHYWENFIESPQSQAADMVSHIYDIDVENILMASLIQPYLELIGEKGRQAAIKELERILKRPVVWRGATSWVKDNAIKFGRRHAAIINKETNKMIRNEIAKAIEGGEDVNKVIERIEKVTSQRITQYRAERIARTELRHAYNQSQLTQYKEMGLEKFDWVGCDDDCPICAPFIAENPHTAEEIAQFDAETHPNCVGDFSPLPPKDFEPKEV